MIAWTKQCNNITKIQVMKMQIGNHSEWQSDIRPSVKDLLKK